MSISCAGSAAAGWRRSARGRHLGAALSRDGYVRRRCATSAACRSISPAGVAAADRAALRTDAAPSRPVRARAAARGRQAPPGARHRRRSRRCASSGRCSRCCCAGSARPALAAAPRGDARPARRRARLAARRRGGRQGGAISAGACAARFAGCPPARRCWSAPTSRPSAPATSPTRFRLLGRHDLVFGRARMAGSGSSARAAPRLPPLVRAGALVEPACARRHARQSAARCRSALLERLDDVDDGAPTAGSRRAAASGSASDAPAAAASARRGCTGGGGCRAGA